MKDIRCEFCGREFSNMGGLVSHSPYCKSNPNRIHRVAGGKGGWTKGKPSPFKGKKAEEIYGKERAEEIRLKVSKALTGKKWICPPETNKKRIEKIKETAKRYGRIGGHRQGSGRGKKGWYKGYWCDSSWELAFVIYNLEHNIPFQRNTESFPYIFEGKEYKYLPDFLMEDGSLIELKGYYTKQVRAKIEQFPKDRVLLVLDKTNFSPYLDYVITKYGKDFVCMYDAVDQSKWYKKLQERKRYHKKKKDIIKKEHKVREKRHYYCKKCGKETYKKTISGLCKECYILTQKKEPDKEFLIEIYNNCNGNKSEVSRKLKIRRNTLIKWYKKFGL